MGDGGCNQSFMGVDSPMNQPNRRPADAPWLGAATADNQEGNNPENQILAYKTRLRATVAPGCSAAPGGAHREGGGRRAAPRPALSAGRKKKQKRGGATPSRVLFVARRHQIDEVPGLVFVLPVSDARVSACKHARAPPTRLPPRPRTEWRLRLRLTSFPPAPQRGTGSLLPPPSEAAH